MIKKQEILNLLICIQLFHFLPLPFYCVGLDIETRQNKTANTYSFILLSTI